MQFSKGCNDGKGCNTAGPWVFRGHIPDGQVEIRRVALDLDQVAISIDARIRPDFDGGAIRANPGKREGGSHIDVGGKSGGCLPCTA